MEDQRIFDPRDRSQFGEKRENLQDTLSLDEVKEIWRKIKAGEDVPVDDLAKFALLAAMAKVRHTTATNGEQ